MPKNNKTKDEGTLTEFQVVERYVVKAKTIDEAWEMVDNNDFNYEGIDKYKLDIQPNF